jgi:hypothetical protein
VTPATAVAAIRQFGTVEAVDGKLKIRVPKDRLVALQPALEVLRNAKAEAFAVLANLSTEELSQASACLARTGVRLIHIGGVMHAGIWSDLDGPDVRAALRTFGSDDAPMLYLDGPHVPLRYKIRRVAGEPVPAQVREEMERHPEPWKVREWMLGKRTSTGYFVRWLLSEPAENSCGIDPETGIRPVAEWGAACGRGFVRSSR